ncbi:MAG: ArsA family ATPase [Thermoleophilia bacterium]
MAPPGPPLAERRLRFVLGKGGAGKSTVAAAMGLAAARAGRRALVVEVAGQEHLSRLFRGADVGHDHEAELAPGLWGVSIDAERATEEYLAGQLRVRPLVEVLTRSRAFHTFAAAAPGLPELVTVGKIWSLAIALDPSGTRPVWDQVIVDCPATGHGIALLETAGNVADLAAEGPIRDQAARIREVVTHPAATGIVIVALPEELAVSEAIEAATTLSGHGLPIAGGVLNGVHPHRFADADAAPLEALAGNHEGPVREAALAARRHLAHQHVDADYRARLAAGCGVPVVELPRIIRSRMDLDGIGELADALAAATGGAP